MPRKRKDVVVINKAEMEQLLEGAFHRGWEGGFAEGREMRATELNIEKRRIQAGSDLAESVVGRIVKAQQRKPAQPKKAGKPDDFANRDSFDASNG